MQAPVEASALPMGSFFAESLFEIPSYQRPYSWELEEEVAEFWHDLQQAIETESYFIGLIILSKKNESNGTYEVIDGQQRLTTITLLANAIRIIADDSAFELASSTIKDIFLFAADYESQKRIPRMSLSNSDNQEILESLLSLTYEQYKKGLNLNNKLTKVQKYFIDEMDKKRNSLGKWATFLRKHLQATQFMHPDRASAYKVFEIINTRGRELAPADLLKAYTLGSLPTKEQQERMTEQWTRLEEGFEDSSRFTTFIRHCLTLTHGYIPQRDLYDIISKHYRSEDELCRMVDFFENQKPQYMRIIDTSSTTDSEPQWVTSALSILSTLNLRTVRPVFLALLNTNADEKAYARITTFMLQRIVKGGFGTGAVERALADTAQKIYKEKSINSETWSSLQELKVDKEEFRLRLADSPLSRATALCLRSAICSNSPLPNIQGTAHNIRARGQEWDTFTNSDFKLAGNTIGNYAVITTGRRPRNSTQSPEDVISSLLPLLAEGEEQFITVEYVKTLSPETLSEMNKKLADLATELYYAR